MPFVADHEVTVRECPNRRKGRDRGANHTEVGDVSHPGSRRLSVLDAHDPVAARKRQRREHRRMQEREGEDRYPEAARQRQHGQRREARRAPYEAQRVANVRPVKHAVSEVVWVDSLANTVDDGIGDRGRAERGNRAHAARASGAVPVDERLGHVARKIGAKRTRVAVKQETIERGDDALSERRPAHALLGFVSSLAARAADTSRARRAASAAAAWRPIGVIA